MFQNLSCVMKMIIRPVYGGPKVHNTFEKHLNETK